MALSKVRRVGGSLVVTIPKKVAEEEGIRVGEKVEVEVHRLKRSYFGAARGIGPFTAEDEMRAHD